MGGTPDRRAIRESSAAATRKCVRESPRVWLCGSRLACGRAFSRVSVSRHASREGESRESGVWCGVEVERGDESSHEWRRREQECATSRRSSWYSGSVVRCLTESGSEEQFCGLCRLHCHSVSTVVTRVDGTLGSVYGLCAELSRRSGVTRACAMSNLGAERMWVVGVSRQRDVT